MSPDFDFDIEDTSFDDADEMQDDYGFSVDDEFEDEDDGNSDEWEIPNSSSIYNSYVDTVDNDDTDQ